VFDVVREVMNARGHHLVVALRYWQDAFVFQSLEWPLVRHRFGNAMASMVGVTTEC
jgi:hypothetical protein